MGIFEIFGNDFNYASVLECDGAFSTAHINYDRSPLFNGIESRNLTNESRKDNLSSKDSVDDVISNLYVFKGIESNFLKEDKLILWKVYWLEYVNAFDKLLSQLPKSIVTAFIGRQAIEIGFKYLLIKKTETAKLSHDLGKLSKEFFDTYEVFDDYMEYIDSFCENYCEYIEGAKAEYFRYPEYKDKQFFSGNRLDINWICRNFALIILKLVHFAELDDELLKN